MERLALHADAIISQIQKPMIALRYQAKLSKMNTKTTNQLQIFPKKSQSLMKCLMGAAILTHPSQHLISSQSHASDSHNDLPSSISAL
jgi:hypothetical protein